MLYERNEMLLQQITNTAGTALPAPKCHLLRCATACSTRILQQQGRLSPFPASTICNMQTRSLMLCTTRAEGQAGGRTTAILSQT